MTPRPARLLAAATTLLLATGLAVAVPADAAKPRATKTAVTAGRAVAGATTTLTATVKPRPSGTVRFSVGGKTLAGCGTVTVRAGKARCSTRFTTAGKRTVVAKYAGKKRTWRASRGTRTIVVAAKPVAARAARTIVGGTGSCTTSSGALVAVDFAKWAGPVVRGCGTDLSSGRTALTSAGVTIAGTQRFPGFVCRLGSSLFDSGRQRPTAAEDPCVNTPPASAYWSLWTAAKGATGWTYSSRGVDADRPGAGSVEAWVFGSTASGGSSGAPAFTPAEVRAGLPASAAALRTVQARTLAAPTAPDLDAAAGYLVDSLVGGTHYEQFDQPDYGLTIDGALALAATGSRDADLRDVVAYLQAHAEDYTFASTKDADGGSSGKLALLAETVGANPRSFGGVDLIATLSKVTCARADADTQCGGAGAFRYTPSLFAHALGVLALLRAGASATAPVGYLLSQQSASGGFWTDSTKSRTETDTTAVAAMALALVPGAKARTALARALRWLASQQAADGGFPGASGNSVNSAALSLQALTLDAETYSRQIAKARQFLGSAQNGDGGFDIAAGGDVPDGSDVRASAQALSGAALIPYGSVLRDLRSQSDAADGADYIVSQLHDGVALQSSYIDPETNSEVTYDDQGLTADGVLALVAAGGHDEDVSRMTSYLLGQAVAYVDPTGELGGPYTGAAAKLALVAYATTEDPTAFGGIDLLQLLRDNICPAAVKGPFSPCTAAGDFRNAFSQVSQALGVLALQASPDPADHLSFDSAPVVRLRQLQCADGGFTSVLITGTQACKSDVDSTGFAVQALVTVPGSDAVLGKAQHYLENAQKSSGLFVDELAGKQNSNSTALAALGLQTLVTALHSQTVDPPGPKTIAPVVPWQRALSGLKTLALDSGYALNPGDGDPNLRASAQAVLAAAQGTLVSLTGARIASTPRDAAVADPGTPPAGGTPPATGPGGATPNAGANAPIAQTGVTTAAQLGWALALLLAGAALVLAGRRRVAAVIGRHRAR